VEKVKGRNQLQKNTLSSVYFAERDQYVSHATIAINGLVFSEAHLEENHRIQLERSASD